eukprot:scaffold77929_cov33-Tisochrysis_lutea.AAC.2
MLHLLSRDYVLHHATFATPLAIPPPSFYGFVTLASAMIMPLSLSSRPVFLVLVSSTRFILSSPWEGTSCSPPQAQRFSSRGGPARIGRS